MQEENQEFDAFWEWGIVLMELMHRVFLQIWDAPHKIVGAKHSGGKLRSKADSFMSECFALTPHLT